MKLFARVVASDTDCSLDSEAPHSAQDDLSEKTRVAKNVSNSVVERRTARTLSPKQKEHGVKGCLGKEAGTDPEISLCLEGS